MASDLIEEGKHVGAKNRLETAARELKATVTKLRAKLEKAEARAERLKSKVAGLEKARGELEAQVKKLTKRLEKASRPVEAPQPPAAKKVVAASRSERPDASWTVVQLRAEAQARGLTGLSSRSKARVLAALAEG